MNHAVSPENNQFREPIECVLCSSSNCIEFHRVESVPVNVGHLATTELCAREATRGTLSLRFCCSCGMVFNSSFNPALIDFSPGYNASLTHSPIFHKSILRTAGRLLEQLKSRHVTPKVLEIGCGSGDLLRAMCNQAPVVAVGIDPSVVSYEQSCGLGSLRLIQDRFNESHAGYLGDLVISISVLEDIARPLEFLKLIRHLIGTREVALYFEVFNGWKAIKSKSVWSPHYEQCNYFSELTLRSLFHQSGFNVIRCEGLPENDDYIAIDAMSCGVSDHCDDRANELSLEHISDFELATTSLIEQWTLQMRRWRSKGSRVHVWGSGGKAVSFLNLIDGSGVVSGVVDINPARQGKYIPGYATKVISPLESFELKPDAIILSNSRYFDEVKEMLGRANQSCPLLMA